MLALLELKICFKVNYFKIDFKFWIQVIFKGILFYQFIFFICRSLSHSTFSTFRGSERHCYANRHGGERRKMESKHSMKTGADGYKSDGYKSDGYKSDGDGYKSDGAGYKSDGEHVKRRTRYSSPSKQPSKYEQDRLTTRRLQANGDPVKSQMRNPEYGSSSRESQGGRDQAISRCSSRGGYRSDPEHEIEIQLQCMGSQQDDSGGSQHSQRGYSVDEEDGKGDWGRQEPMIRSQDTMDSRSQSRNGYKSDGSHGSLQESPLHPGMMKCEGMTHPSNCNSGRGMRRGFLHGNVQSHSASHLNSHSAAHLNSHSASHLNSHYSNQHQPQPLQQQQQQQRLLIHPTKHLEASRSFHTFQRQESTTSFHSTHSAPNPPPHHNQNLMVNNLESASQASTHSHSSSSSASLGPPDYSTVIHPPPTYDQALIKLDIAMRRRAANKNRIAQQHKGTYNSLHYVGEFYG